MGFGFKVLRWSTPSFLQTTNVLWVHEGRPDRAEGTLYVQSTCMNVQGRLCTVTPEGRPCTRPSASSSEWNAWTQMRPDEKNSCASTHINWNRRRATLHCKTMDTREHTKRNMKLRMTEAIMRIQLRICKPITTKTIHHTNWRSASIIAARFP